MKVWRDFLGNLRSLQMEVNGSPVRTAKVAKLSFAPHNPSVDGNPVD